MDLQRARQIDVGLSATVPCRLLGSGNMELFCVTAEEQHVYTSPPPRLRSKSTLLQNNALGTIFTTSSDTQLVLNQLATI